MASVMSLLGTAGIFPLSRETWTLLLSYWKYFTFVTPIQLLISWYPMGKTSNTSCFNLPGRPSWVFMELFAPLTLLTTMFSVHASSSSPSSIPPLNLYIAGLFIIHYIHRALLSPLRNPSMAPTHAVLTLAGVAFNLVNGMAIGGWLGGYGLGRFSRNVGWPWVVGGSVLWAAGLAGNIWHEEVLRSIRRRGEGKGRKGEKKGEVVEMNGRRYEVPVGGGFEWVWFPHYLSEWIEWSGFCLIGGGPARFLPAALFVINEIATMLPRAIQGKGWYEEKFGKKAPKRWAAVPGFV